jgi:hypothetical protein
MKLNQIQRYILLSWLSKNLRNWDEGYAYEFDSFCDGEFQEWRIVSDFGLAGKLWNNDGRIYISGYSPSEIGGHESNAWKEQQEKLDKWNQEIAELIGIHSI